jgi:hypothetical protein
MLCVTVLDVRHSVNDLSGLDFSNLVFWDYAHILLFLV